MSSAKYRRILLKVSGEMLAGEQGYGIQPSILEGLADEIAAVVAMDVEVAVVIGGGNIFRGIWRPVRAAWNGLPPTTWACWPLCSTPSPSKIAGSEKALPPAYNRRSKCANSRKGISVVAPSGIWKKSVS